MRCLVTGCAGFIGSHLAEALVRAGHTVLGVDCFTDYYPKRVKLSNLSSLRKVDGFEFKEQNLASSDLSTIVKGVDAVFHLAAQPGVRASWGVTFSQYVADNIVATQRLLEAVKSEPIERFVFASSSSIYGNSERLPTPESATPKPVSPYGVTKLTGEHLCRLYFRSYGVRVVTLRYFTVYGPRQRPDMAFSRFVARISAENELEVFGDGEQRRDFTFVGDIVSGNILALRATPGKTYNIGAGTTASINEVISTLENIIGKAARVRRRAPAVGDVTNTSADIGRISSDLGYAPRKTLTAGLREQVAYQLAW